MLRLQSVLVPLDASRLAERALPLAADLAARAGGQLHLLMVHVPPPAWATPQMGAADVELDREIRESEGAYVTGQLQAAAAAWQVPVCEALVDGAIPEAVERYADRHAVDLIVMTTHGRGPVSRLWLGSVADRLIRSAARPILLLHPGAARVPGCLGDFHRVLVTLDGSRFSEAAEPAAREIARLSGAEVEFFSVVEPAPAPWLPLAGVALPAEPVAELRARLDRVEDYLERRAEAFRTDGITAQHAVLTGPDPAAAILHRAREGQADLIVMATHGRGGIERVLLGSVTDKVVRSAPVPVLVCPPAMIPAEAVSPAAEARPSPPPLPVLVQG